MKSNNESPNVAYVISIYLAYILFFILCSPVYFMNKLDFNRMRKKNPLYISKFVRVAEKYPLVYDLSMFVLNFPNPKNVYACLPEFSGKVLQIGCGTGLLNQFYKKDTTKVFTNIDVNLEALKWGLKRGRFDDYIHGSVTSIKLPEESFDAVIWARCYHHIKHHKKAFQESARLLKQGGVLIITDPVLLASKEQKVMNSENGIMGNSSLDGIIWRFSKKSFVHQIEKNKGNALKLIDVYFNRQLHLTNYNFKYPQSDAVAILKKN